MHHGRERERVLSVFLSSLVCPLHLVSQFIQSDADFFAPFSCGQRRVKITPNGMNHEVTPTQARKLGAKVGFTIVVVWWTQQMAKME